MLLSFERRGRLTVNVERRARAVAVARLQIGDEAERERRRAGRIRLDPGAIAQLRRRSGRHVAVKSVERAPPRKRPDIGERPADGSTARARISAAAQRLVKAESAAVRTGAADRRRPQRRTRDERPARGAREDRCRALRWREAPGRDVLDAPGTWVLNSVGRKSNSKE